VIKRYGIYFLEEQIESFLPGDSDYYVKRESITEILLFSGEPSNPPVHATGKEQW
jgi:hypothetical protein